ncbi:Zinc finger (C3HC4-type RING finger) family protein [Forsythia ovata]|uniref:Zinc finger (C3HC4-type RING finger) family protein n=1 Tax=Forsythia ovata TaxID=205694 RepID=A0ABD1QD36_9LAMI
MPGTWSKLKKTLSFKTSNGSTSQHSPSLPNTSNSRSTVDFSPTSSSRFSRSFNSTPYSSKLQKTCAICLENLKTGQGRAIFMAECSHSFHFSCIANSIRHGNDLCPICRTTWKEIPFQLSNVNTDANNNAADRALVSPYQAPLEDYPPNYNHVLQPPSPPRSRLMQYSDDEPLLPMPEDLILPTSRSHSNTVTVKAFAEFSAVAASESVSAFAVLVGVRGPSLLDDAHNVERAPIDLVTVLDVSGSMAGPKLVLLKQAVCFVIENLRPSDRLSIVSFSDTAKRVFPLRRMNDRGRKDARQAVNSLSSDGGTDIIQGLRKGMRVLAERREKNPVASIILLSDGKDSYYCDNINPRRGRQNLMNAISSNPSQVLEYFNLLPISLCPSIGETQNQGQQPTFPVHSFGFGSDHDSSVMLTISDASGGTFSFIESVGMVQDAFARCIGGLLSVVAQELQLTVSSASSGVEIGSIPSGKYTSEISDLRHLGVINIGDLYADEEKEFLVYLSIPLSPASEGEEGAEKISLVKTECSFWDTISKEMVRVEGKKVEIHRPKVLSPTDVIVSLEVDCQRNRLQVAEGISKAQEMAEMGNMEGAQAVLMKTRSTLLSSASAQAGDGLCSWLEAELIEIRERMASMEMYEHTGRAYVLSGLSSHSWQRATTRGDSTTQTILLREGGCSSKTVSIGYDTPSMVSMVSKSQNLSVNYQAEYVQRLNKSTSLIKM